MLQNPFVDEININEAFLKDLDEEIRIREARDTLLGYELYVHNHYVPSKFHTYLCNTVQKFLETDTGHALDVLLLSVPPQ